MWFRSVREHEKRNDPSVELKQLKENITTHETCKRKCHNLQDAREITNDITHEKKRMVSRTDNKNQCKLS